jgi:hypothetical protein
MGVLAYNALNHSNAANPNVSMSSVLFGMPTTNKTGDTRTMAIQGRIDF